MTYITISWLYVQSIALATFLLRDAAGAISAVTYDPSQAQAMIIAAFAPVAILQVGIFRQI